MLEPTRANALLGADHRDQAATIREGGRDRKAEGSVRSSVGLGLRLERGRSSLAVSLLGLLYHWALILHKD